MRLAGALLWSLSAEASPGAGALARDGDARSPSELRVTLCDRVPASDTVRNIAHGASGDGGATPRPTPTWTSADGGGPGGVAGVDSAFGVCGGAGVPWAPRAVLGRVPPPLRLPELPLRGAALAGVDARGVVVVGRGGSGSSLGLWAIGAARPRDPSTTGGLVCGGDTYTDGETSSTASSPQAAAHHRPRSSAATAARGPTPKAPPAAPAGSPDVAVMMPRHRGPTSRGTVASFVDARTSPMSPPTGADSDSPASGAAASPSSVPPRVSPPPQQLPVASAASAPGSPTSLFGRLDGAGRSPRGVGGHGGAGRLALEYSGRLESQAAAGLLAPSSVTLTQVPGLVRPSSAAAVATVVAEAESLTPSRAASA